MVFIVLACDQSWYPKVYTSVVSLLDYFILAYNAYLHVDKPRFGRSVSYKALVFSGMRCNPPCNYIVHVGVCASQRETRTQLMR
jgi:hypothetical protein